MLYPNRLQAVLLFDRPMPALEAAMRDFLRIEGMKTGASFNLSDEKPGRFYRLFGAAEELMLTFEYSDLPAATAVFEAALASPYTGIVTPDIRDRIARAQSHVLLEASHGVLAGVEEDPKIAAMFEQIGQPRSGASLAQFQRRLAVLALMTRIVTDHAAPLAVHWTQSDLLVSGELFDTLAASPDIPGPLHIHPVLFGPAPQPGEAALIGIRTFGARHWLGREIIVRPHPLPWAANLETILAFLRIATMPNGYVIPDSDTFGPEDRSLSYRVLHHDAGAEIGSASGPTDIPLYELVPLKHLAHGFLAPDHVPHTATFDDRAFPPHIMPGDQDAKATLANEWAEKRRLAEGIGGRFEVRAAGEPAPEPPPPPFPPGPPRLGARGLRVQGFGRKGL